MLIKRVVNKLRIVISFLLLRHFKFIANDIAVKYDGLDIVDLRKTEKLHLKLKKAELDINFLTNCQHLNVFPKFLCFRLPNIDQHERTLIRKKLLKQAVYKTEERER